MFFVKDAHKMTPRQYSQATAKVRAIAQTKAAILLLKSEKITTYLEYTNTDSRYDPENHQRTAEELTELNHHLTQAVKEYRQQRKDLAKLYSHVQACYQARIKAQMEQAHSMSGKDLHEPLRTYSLINRHTKKAEGQEYLTDSQAQRLNEMLTDSQAPVYWERLRNLNDDLYNRKGHHIKPY